MLHLNGILGERGENDAGNTSVHDRDGRWEDDGDFGERRVVDGAWAGEVLEN